MPQSQIVALPRHQEEEETDKLQQNAESDQGLHCMPLIQQFYTDSKVVK